MPLLLLSLLWSCTPQGASSSPSPYQEPEEAETEWLFDIAVVRAERMATVMTVTFSSAVAGEGWVTFGGPDGSASETPRGPVGLSHEATLLGLPPLAEVPARACLAVGEEVHCTEPFRIESGGFLPGTPELTVTVQEQDYEEDPSLPTTLLMSVFNFSGVGHVIMSNLAGEVFWSTDQGSDVLVGNGVLPVPGGIAYNLFAVHSSEGSVEQVSLLNESLGSYTTPSAHHFFDFHPDGGVCWLAPDIRRVDGVEILGDQIRCGDGSGESWRMFSIWDHMTVDMSIDMPGEVRDWTHGNWLHYDPRRGTFLFSAAYIHTILELSPQGEILAEFVGTANTRPEAHQIAPGTPGFRLPHGAHWAENGDLLLFAASDTGNTARAARYAIDPVSRTLQQVWEHTDDDRHNVSVLGEVQELDNGDLLISWGGAGVVQIVSPEGEILWEMLTDFGEIPSQVHLLSSPYL